jgi:hypothetical protein
MVPARPLGSARSYESAGVMGRLGLSTMIVDNAEQRGRSLTRVDFQSRSAPNGLLSFASISLTAQRMALSVLMRGLMDRAEAAKRFGCLTVGVPKEIACEN